MRNFNLIEFTSFNFPAGEVHLKLSGEELRSYHNLVLLRDENPNNLLIQILLVDDILKRNNQNDVSLFLPYLPYSRQDRPTSLCEPFSLKVIGDLLNQTNFSKIYTLDAHSDVAYACIGKLENIKIDFIFNQFKKKYPALVNKTLVVPDQGAYKRLSKLSDQFSGTVFSLKDRDISNGFLTIKQVIGDVLDKDCLIIDDIIDGAGTFILLADKLYKEGARSVELMVTHSILSKGIDIVKAAGIGKIYTTNSFQHPTNDFLDVIDVLDIINQL